MSTLQERVRDQSIALRQLLSTLSETQKPVISSLVTTSTTSASTDLDSLLLRDQLEDANEASLVLEQDLAAVTALCLKKAKRCEELSALVARLEREKVTLHRMLIEGSDTSSSSFFSSLVFLAFSSTTLPLSSMSSLPGSATENAPSTTRHVHVSSIIRIIRGVATGLLSFFFYSLSHTMSVFASLVFAFGLAFISESYISAPFPDAIPSHSIFTFIVPIFESYSFQSLYNRSSGLLHNNVGKNQDGNSLMSAFSEWGRSGSAGIVEQVLRKLNVILLINDFDEKESDKESLINSKQEQLLVSRSIRQVIAPLFVSLVSLYFLLFVSRRLRRTWETLFDVSCSLFASIVMIRPIYMNNEGQVMLNEESKSICHDNFSLLLLPSSIYCLMQRSSLSHPFPLAVALSSTALGTWIVSRWRSSRDLSRPRVYLTESRVTSSTEGFSIQTLFFNILDACACALSLLTSAAYVLNLLNTGAAGKTPSDRWSFGMFADDLSIGHDLSALSSLLCAYWIAVSISAWVSARQGRVRAYAMRLGLLASGTSEGGEHGSGSEGGGLSYHSSNSLSLLQTHEKECTAAESAALASMVATLLSVFAITVAFSCYSAMSHSLLSSTTLLKSSLDSEYDGGGGGICFNDPSLYSDGLPPIGATDCFMNGNTSFNGSSSTTGGGVVVNAREIDFQSVLFSPGTWLLSFITTTLSIRQR